MSDAGTGGWPAAARPLAAITVLDDVTGEIGRWPGGMPGATG